MNPIPDTRYPILKLLIVTILIYGLWTIDYGLIYAQTEKLDVDGDLEIQSTESDATPPVPLRHGLIFKPLYTTTVPPTAPPPPESRGQIYYNGDSNKKNFVYHNASGWVDLGGGPAAQDKYVATRIVAAYNSLGSTQDGTPTGLVCSNNGTTPCKNPKADTNYTCDGLNDQETINNAITEVGSRGGGAVYLLEGTYNISSAGVGLNGGIMINADNVALIGTGPGTLLLSKLPGSDYLIYVSGNGVLISQLKLSAENAIGGILLEGNDSKIDKVWLQFKASIILSGAKNIVSNCSFSDMQGVREVIYISGPNNIVYNNIIFDIVWTGIDIRGANNTIEGNNLQHTEGGQRSIMLVYGQEANSNLIDANNFSFHDPGPSAANGGLCLGISDVQPGPSANIITNNNFDRVGTECYYWFDPYDISVSCHGSIALCSAESNIVSNNLVYSGNINLGIIGSTSYYTQNNLISGNMVYDSTNSGIQFKGDAKANLISFNHISNPTKKNIGIEGVNTGTDATDTYIFGNFINHATVATPLISAPGTQYTQREKMTLERGDVVTGVIKTTEHLSYVPVISNGGGVQGTIVVGKSEGDILILEGTDDTNYVYFEGPGIGGTSGRRDLKKNDILKLIWTFQGGWRELGYSDNYTSP